MSAVAVDEVAAKELARVAESRLRALEDLQPKFVGNNTITPPIPPHKLSFLYHHSSSIRKCIDAITQNVDGFGHELIPVIELDDDDALAEAIYLEWEREKSDDRTKDREDVKARPEWPPQEYVDERRTALRMEFRKEKAKLTQFFSLCSRVPFVQARKLLRTDLESYGYAFFEVLRDTQGMAREFVNTRAWTIRLCTLSPYIRTRERIRTGPLGFDVIESSRRFHLFVQEVPGLGLGATYFKEFGDPRVIDAATGGVHRCKECWIPDGEEFCVVCQPEGDRNIKTPLGNRKAAGELVHFSIYALTSVYGLPRWFGAFLEAMISREATERDWAVLKNASTPELMFIVEGGSLPDDFKAEYAKHIESNQQGTHNAGRFMCLAVPMQEGATTPPKVRAETLAKGSLSAGDLAKLKAANDDDIRQQFRLGPTVTGQQISSNRATADAELEQAETQVFSPLREEFDAWVNLMLLSMGFRYHTFRSRGPKIEDHTAKAKILEILSKCGLVTAKDARPDVESILGRDLPKLEYPGADLPLSVALAFIAQAMLDAQGAVTAAPVPGAPGDGEEKAADSLMSLRDRLQALAESRATARFKSGDDDRTDAEPTDAA